MSDLYARPHGYGTIFVEMLDGEGRTGSGIELQHHVKLPKVYARVADIAETHEALRVNDLVVLFPNAEQEITWSGEPFAVVHEASIRAVISKPDGSPYFEEFDVE